ncbi:ABC transporter permease [Phototrophicus methaneseepsis]|uniref:ABC transporter permease n=1 Tax=Phototrophicus methaneseepsis TaxID=2710758 RepID=A0A7S8EAJ2_9CHLR|nr:ABC transporter permease [Phototrophicus methaneseepsis]QPC83273.1 ABC transporter permease [Phototrophicus methaneseepsis]
MTNVSAIEIDRQSTRRGRFESFVRRLLNSRNVVIGGVILLLMILLTTLAPVISTYDPIELNPRARLQPPSAEHLFGTDDFGRDVFTRVLYGGRLSLQVGLISVAIACTIGTTLGILAGYYGGIVDLIIMRLMDVMLAFPGILLALAIVAVLGKSLPNVMIAVGISTIPVFTRIVRGTTLSVKQSDFIVAARALGANNGRIMFRHVLPNVITPIIVVATNGVAGAIISGAALSFLGLGAQPPTPEWGIMLSEGRVYLRAAAWITTFPGLAIMVTVLSINLLGDGLRDALDPRLKK